MRAPAALMPVAVAFVLACGDPSNDTPLVDAGAADAGTVVDAYTAPEASVQDSSVQDASVQDASVPDAGDGAPADAGARTDAETEDSALPDAWIPPPPPDAPTGPFADAAAPCEPEAPAAICQRLGAECGSLDTVDLCGAPRSVTCGTCAAGSRCGGVVANRCEACVAETNEAFCVRLGKNCGVVSGLDDCGAARTAACGSCAANEACTSANVCACTPEANAAFCTRLGANCGSVTAVDNCGGARTASCGSCSSPLTCGGGGTANVCGSAPVCAAPSTTPAFTAAAAIPGAAPFAQGACTAAQVDALFDACFASTASAAACEGWRLANAACRGCAFTPESASAYGPVVTRPPLVDAASNPLGLFDESVRFGVQACLERGRVGCGSAYFSHEACLVASCDASAGCDGASGSALASCRASAQVSACGGTYAAMFGTSGACVGVLSTGSTPLAGDACIPTAAEQAPGDAGPKSFITRLVLRFCGP